MDTATRVLQYKLTCSRRPIKLTEASIEHECSACLSHFSRCLECPRTASPPCRATPLGVFTSLPRHLSPLEVGFTPPVFRVYWSLSYRFIPPPQYTKLHTCVCVSEHLILGPRRAPCRTTASFPVPLPLPPLANRVLLCHVCVSDHLLPLYLPPTLPSFTVVPPTFSCLSHFSRCLEYPRTASPPCQAASTPSPSWK